MSSAARTLLRRTATVLAAGCLAAGLGLVAPAAAGADTGVTVSCQTSGTMRFSPGVQLVPLPQQVSYDGREGMCQDNSGLDIVGARLTGSFQGVLMTCELGGIGTGTGSGTIEWVTDSGVVVDSHVDLRFDHNIGPLVSISGTVTDGPFAGQSLSSSFTTNIFGGAGECVLHAPFGGFTKGEFSGQFTIG